MPEKNIPGHSECIQFCYWLREDIIIAREDEYITLYSQETRRLSIEFSEASLEELTYLKEKGKSSLVLLDAHSQTSDSSNLQQDRFDNSGKSDVLSAHS